MNSRVLKQVVRYLVGWSVAIFFVVLLTLIFSFLGTIICAALAGMMIGAARLPRWQAFAISLIFPAVITGVLRTSGADLSDRQVLLLALLCFAAFWLIYAVVAAMMRVEGRQGAGASEKPASRVRRSRAATGAVALAPPDPAVAFGRLTGLGLAALEGRWHAEHNGHSTNGYERVLEIDKETLRLSLTTSTGQVSCSVCAQLKVATQDSRTTVSVYCEDPETLISI